MFKESETFVPPHLQRDSEALRRMTQQTLPPLETVVTSVDSSCPLVVLPDQPLKLDLACGQRPRDGYDGVDIRAPDAKYKIDLLKFPWPLESNSVDALHCSHFIEHIPCREVETRDLVGPCDYLDHDMFLAFFDEVYRVLKSDGEATIIWPALQSCRAFQDPTHRRFIPQEALGYLSEEWRKANKLDHYPVKCNFMVNVVPTMPVEMTLLHPEAQARRYNESWNVLYDFHATLKPVKT